MLKVDEVSYIAGFFDGEGSVGLYATTKTQRYNLRVCINQVQSRESVELFELLKEHFGGSLAFPKLQKPHHQQAISWSVYGDSAASFLDSILPFLRMKKRAANLVVQWQRNYGSSKSHPHDQERQQEKLRAAVEVNRQIRNPKRKGPKNEHRGNP